MPSRRRAAPFPGSKKAGRAALQAELLVNFSAKILAHFPDTSECRDRRVFESREIPAKLMQKSAVKKCFLRHSVKISKVCVNCSLHRSKRTVSLSTSFDNFVEV